jgi:HSP20 family molecular chaperone IbpA
MKIIIISFLLSLSLVVNANMSDNTPTLISNPQIPQHQQYKFLNFVNNMFNDDFFKKMNNLNQVMMQELQVDNFFANKSWLRFDKKNKTYEVRIDMGNLEKNEIDITTQNRFLIVKGISSSNTDKTKKMSSFHQSFNLPEDADISNISAKQSNGVLLIKIPKIKIKTKKIKVQ